MQLIGAVLVFLSGASLGTLVFLCLRVLRSAERAEEHRAHALELAERRHRERLDHANALATVLSDQVRLVAARLGAEIRQSASAYRNDLRLAGALPPLRVPRSPPGSPPSSARPAAPPPRYPVSNGVLGDNEPTPPSGWTLEQIRAHTHQPDDSTPP